MTVQLNPNAVTLLANTFGASSYAYSNLMSAAQTSSYAWNLKGFHVLSLTVLLALLPNMVVARSTDQQANNAYELVSSGCVAVNNEIPFFKGPPDSVARTVSGESVQERRQYNNSQVSTLFGYGKLFIEQL